MAGALIGEAFLSASIQALCGKIASGEFMDLFRGKRLDHSLMEKLKMTLLTLHAVLNDAEDKQISDPAVGKWLDELKHAVFDAQDLLDEIDTEALRCKVEAECQTKRTQVRNFLFTSLNPFYQGMNAKIQDLFVRLELLAQHKDVLGLKRVVGGKFSQRTPTTSFVEHNFCTYGRDADKEKLVTILLSDDASKSDISVIPIVGMGGVGKTTLAQLLYHDDKVKEHFHVRAWTCVSEDFDSVRVTKTLLESITLKPHDRLDMNLLQIELGEEVRGKKFLFVLDDLWNDNYNDWELLRAPFTYGARGSKVIVTTRNESVASIVHTVPVHYVEQLSHEDCWLLLAKHAFRNENPGAHPVLEEIGKKIAQKCNGLPLAAKALGGLLSCDTDYEKWKQILNSKLWELLDKSVLPALRLSYHYLPAYLKQCFAYCSIFPKDFEFEKDDIILLWMAVGLIPQREGEKTMEEVSETYFDELLSRSLLQRSRIGESSFTMHDLINDLAMFVSKEFSFRLDEGEPHEVPKRVRHFSYMRGRYDTAPKFQPLHGANCLRTFLPLSNPGLYGSSNVSLNILPSLKCLRVLSLSRYKNITHVPTCIGNHIHLRYIDLSYTAIERLPDIICTLYNLQTLLLVGCSSLVELPVDMRKLVNLRHLDVSGTDIEEMPVQMGRLKNLRTLTAFVLGKSTGSSIGELRELTHLQGKLSILNLQNVANSTDALSANLIDKKDIKELELAWGREDADDSQKERDVLDVLQPSINLAKLTVRSYGGTSFPKWLGDSSFCSIQVMRLSDCSNCLSLPPVGQLPALKELYIESMKFVMVIGPEFYGGNEASLNQPFQCLEKLVLKDMTEWEEWQPSSSGGEHPDFPCLQELILKKCPKLRGSFPEHLPSLKKLSVFDCGVLEERVATTLNTECLRHSLEDLTIDGCPGLLSLLDLEIVRNGNRLQKLTLGNSPSLFLIPRNALPSTLTSLTLNRCRRLEFLSHEMMAKLTSLKYLSLHSSCASLWCFPLGIFPKLSNLQLRDCESLECLAIEEGADENKLSHLNTLDIDKCPNLVSIPNDGLRTPNLSWLSVSFCENLKLLPDRIHTLTSLRLLHMYRLPNLESFGQGGLPPNLQDFRIIDCDRLRPLVEWGLQRLASLKECTIMGSEDVLETLLKENLLPTTLHTLRILDMKSLKSVDGKGLQQLTSLQKLEIHSGRSLEFLPETGNLPPSLSCLSITDCSALKKRYQNKMGEDWSKIAHIFA